MWHRSSNLRGGPYVYTPEDASFWHLIILKIYNFSYLHACLHDRNLSIVLSLMLLLLYQTVVQSVSLYSSHTLTVIVTAAAIRHQLFKHQSLRDNQWPSAVFPFRHDSQITATYGCYSSVLPIRWHIFRKSFGTEEMTTNEGNSTTLSFEISRTTSC